MVTECLVPAVYRTSCNRCRAVMPAAFEEWEGWVLVEVRGRTGPPVQVDLCPPCEGEYARFVEGKAIPGVS